MRFLYTWVEDSQGRKVGSIRAGQPFQIVAGYEVFDNKAIADPRIAFAIRDSLGNYFTDLWNQAAGYSWQELPQKGIIICKIPKCPLNEGVYYYNLYCASKNIILDFVRDAGKFSVEWGDFFGTNKLPSPRIGRFLFEHKWELHQAK